MSYIIENGDNLTILVTNDDGYSKGLEMLLKAAKQIDEAYAVIPSTHQSAVSSSITLHKALRFNEHSEDIYTLSGSPADCVLFSLYSNELKKPNLILSGVNFGDNSTAGGIVCSGTVGACWVAAVESVPSIAFSLYIRDREAWKDKSNWGDEKVIVPLLVKLIQELKPQCEKGALFSVNMPIDPSKSKIIFSSKLQEKRFDTTFEKRIDPRGEPYYWCGGGFAKPKEGTDYYEVSYNHNIVITKISTDFVK